MHLNARNWFQPIQRTGPGLYSQMVFIYCQFGCKMTRSASIGRKKSPVPWILLRLCGTVGSKLPLAGCVPQVRPACGACWSKRPGCDGNRSSREDVYNRFLGRMGVTQKAIAAVARKLAVILWKIRMEHRNYRPVVL
jgi:hypothetical protein